MVYPIHRERNGGTPLFSLIQNFTFASLSWVHVCTYVLN